MRMEKNVSIKHKTRGCKSKRVNSKLLDLRIQDQQTWNHPKAEPEKEFRKRLIDE